MICRSQIYANTLPCRRLGVSIRIQLSLSAPADQDAENPTLPGFMIPLGSSVFFEHLHNVDGAVAKLPAEVLLGVHQLTTWRRPLDLTLLPIPTPCSPSRRSVHAVYLLSLRLTGTGSVQRDSPFYHLPARQLILFHHTTRSLDGQPHRPFQTRPVLTG